MKILRLLIILTVTLTASQLFAGGGGGGGDAGVNFIAAFANIPNSSRDVDSVHYLTSTSSELYLWAAASRAVQGDFLTSEQKKIAWQLFKEYGEIVPELRY